MNDPHRSGTHSPNTSATDASTGYYQQYAQPDAYSDWGGHTGLVMDDDPLFGPIPGAYDSAPHGSGYDTGYAQYTDYSGVDYSGVAPDDGYGYQPLGADSFTTGPTHQGGATDIGEPGGYDNAPYLAQVSGESWYDHGMSYGGGTAYPTAGYDPLTQPAFGLGPAPGLDHQGIPEAQDAFTGFDPLTAHDFGGTPEVVDALIDHPHHVSFDGHGAQLWDTGGYPQVPPPHQPLHDQHPGSIPGYPDPSSGYPDVPGDYPYLGGAHDRSGASAYADDHAAGHHDALGEPAAGYEPTAGYEPVDAFDPDSGPVDGVDDDELDELAPLRARRDRNRSASAARNRRRRAVKRSALLTIAVPSVAVMGVAAVAAAAVVTPDSGSGTDSGDGQADGPTSTSVAATKLDQQLANLTADADDFANRASRTQVRIDLKERQAAEKKRKEEEAARKEALRPKFLLPVKQHGLSALYGQAGVNWMSVHTGIDFPVSYGTPVMAATDGTVRTQWGGAYGNMAIVTAPDGTETWYCHLSSTKIRSGSVKAGDVIAYSGNSGNSTGPHLHFEVRPGGGSPIDPLPWLASKGLNPR